MEPVPEIRLIRDRRVQIRTKDVNWVQRTEPAAECLRKTAPESAVPTRIAVLRIPGSRTVDGAAGADPDGAEDEIN